MAGRGQAPGHGRDAAPAVVDDVERSHFSKLLAKIAGRIVTGLLDPAIALAPETQEIVILGDDLAAGTREIQGEGGHVAAQVIDPEDQVLGQLLGIAPDHPANAQGRQPELVAGGVDGFHARQPEIPEEIGIVEGGEKAAAGGVDMHGNVQARIGLQLVQRLTDLGHGFVLAGVGHAQGRHHADGVFVAPGQGFRRAHDEPILFHGDFAQFDIPVAGELVPADLHRAADQIGLVHGFAGGL